METSKLFLKTGEQTFAEKIAEKYAEAGAETVVFVVNQNDFATLKDPMLHFPGQIQFVINDNPLLGRFRSIRLGLAALPPDMPCFLQNIDNPVISKDVITNLLKSTVPDNTVIPSYKNKHGHPILIGTGIQKKLLEITNNDCNLKSVLNRYNTTVIEVHCPEILFNINTPDEYKKFLQNQQH